MWETSKIPARSRTALCSLIMLLYCTGISQPLNSTIFAPRPTWVPCSTVLRRLSLIETPSSSRPSPPQNTPRALRLMAWHIVAHTARAEQRRFDFVRAPTYNAQHPQRSSDMKLSDRSYESWEYETS